MLSCLPIVGCRNCGSVCDSMQRGRALQGGLCMQQDGITHETLWASSECISLRYLDFWLR